jgi:site-specific DNA-methyltransferase (adenine-specific)
MPQIRATNDLSGQAYLLAEIVLHDKQSFLRVTGNDRARSVHGRSCPPSNEDREMKPTQIIYCRDSIALDENYVKHFDVQIADLPYREHVHANATSHNYKNRTTRKRDLGFDSLSNQLRERAAFWSAHVRRWSIFYSDVEDSHLLRDAASKNGTEYIRTIPWVRWSMPQLSGDRPPQGFEHVLLLHPKGKKHWNGPGNLTHFSHLRLTGDKKHKCEKPLDQALDIVSFFSDVGEWIFDPCAGHGTIGIACRLLGRNYVGFEMNQEWAEKGQRRLLGDPNDISRIIRWLESDSEPVATLTEGPSLIRAAARALDKENVRRGIYL